MSVYGQQKQAVGSWKKYLDPNYLGTWAIPEKGCLILTIDKVTEAIGAKIQGDKKDVGLIWFKENHMTLGKPLIMNVAIGDAITKIAGTKRPELWGGIQIVLIVQEGIKAFGSITDGVRVSKYSPEEARKVFKTDVKEKLEIGHEKFEVSKKYIKEGGSMVELEKRFEISEDVKKELIK